MIRSKRYTRGQLARVRSLIDKAEQLLDELPAHSWAYIELNQAHAKLLNCRGQLEGALLSPKSSNRS